MIAWENTFLINFSLFSLFLIWGSFLNVIGYRIIKSEMPTGRSYCPHCHHTIAWYDLLPVISFLVLRGRCRHCHKVISWLYPFVELITAIIMTALIMNTSIIYFPAYFIFFSALIVTIRSDIETMLISRYVTLFLIPVGVLASYFKLLPISATESIVAAVVGGSCLWLIGHIFYLITNKVGLGQGDVDLLAFIGTFTGILGVWSTVLIASILGSIFGISFMISSGSKESIRISFGPFLAMGAIGYVLYAQKISAIIYRI